MNPRIQKLYEQSWVEGSYQEPITNDDVGVFGNEQRYRTVKTSHFHHEHFAHLIIRECAKKGFDIFDEEPDAPASDLQFYVRDRILQHFGVDE